MKAGAHFNNRKWESTFTAREWDLANLMRANVGVFFPYHQWSDILRFGESGGVVIMRLDDGQEGKPPPVDILLADRMFLLLDLAFQANYRRIKIIIQPWNEPDVGWDDPEGFAAWSIEFYQKCKPLYPNLQIGISPLSCPLKNERWAEAIAEIVHAGAYDCLLLHSYGETVQQFLADKWFGLNPLLWRDYLGDIPIWVTEFGLDSDQ